MNTFDFWKTFTETGSVEDYLSYCNSKTEPVGENEDENEHQRNNPQRTEYR